MFELLIVIVLAKVFWNYGRSMGTGKWLSAGIYILSCFGCTQFGFGTFSALFAIIPASVVLMLLSSMHDKQRIQALRDSKEHEALRKAIPNVYPQDR